MGRRASLPASLFPFMSVLACTIGALVILLAVMALAAVDTTRARPGAIRALYRVPSRCAEHSASNSSWHSGQIFRWWRNWP